MYAQAFGAVLGLIACLYEYVCGGITIIGNKPFPNAGIISVFCGYTLYLLCLIILLLSFVLPLMDKQPDKFYEINQINKFLTHLTVIIGLLGCKYYFIVPGILILYNYYMPVLFEDDFKNEEDLDHEYDFKHKDKKTQKQIDAINLLNNDVSKHTIVKLLNMSYEEVEELELEILGQKNI